MQERPKVWTASTGLLTALAQMLQSSDTYSLSDFTVLVPNRRAARALQQKLAPRPGEPAVLLPRIRPIGDVDEDLLTAVWPHEGLPDALSPVGQLFLFRRLVLDWARDTLQHDLARDVLASPSQALGLAKSMSEFFNQVETEEIDLANIELLFEMDLAEHRTAISSLLKLVSERVPQELFRLGLMSAARRRNQLIRREAQRIADGGHVGPIIAAGSTGTNPATRALLQAVLHHPEGMLVLPGLDVTMSEADFLSLAPEHPQYGFKILLGELGLTPGDVKVLPGAAPQRLHLISEIMRPAAQSEKWREAEVLHKLKSLPEDNTIMLVEAPDRHLEARAIAVMMRQVLEHDGQTAALVTPDRDLGRRVAMELQRWQVDVDDSGGQALFSTAAGQLFSSVLAFVRDGFSVSALSILLQNRLLTLGDADSQRLFGILDVSVFRTDAPPRNLAGLATSLRQLRSEVKQNRHIHRAVQAISDDDWDRVEALSLHLAAVLAPLEAHDERPFSLQLATIEQAYLTLIGPDCTDAAHAHLLESLEGIREASQQHPSCTLREAAVSIREVLSQDRLRPRRDDHARLAIYGLLEARLMEADLIILGGLNEGVWPAVADPGPWVNRSMRKALGLQSPERDTGITAHDFAMGLSHPRVALTWCLRRGSEPVVASRFVLRLRLLLEVLGRKREEQTADGTVALARALDHPRFFKTVTDPRPRPEVHLRPRQFSVTEIETLRRDPYAVYARRVLSLQPLRAIGQEPDFALRGTLFHEAITRWLRTNALTLPLLIEQGEQVFAPYTDYPDIRYFWWPRFLRMAEALVEIESGLARDVAQTFVEIRGRDEFLVGKDKHALTARADRIDILSSGKLRIIDYKTGSTPTEKMVRSGLSPQLTLEAAIAARSTFGDQVTGETEALLYIQTSGASPAAAQKPVLAKDNIMEVVQAHFQGLVGLLTRYRDRNVPYLSRTALFKEDDPSDFEHLSRYKEWSLGQS